MRLKTLLLSFCLVAGTACIQSRTAIDAKFGDQNFKSAIALIELYKVRHGAYPDSLKAIDFTGDWDQIYLSSVRYEKLPDGYALDAVRGWVGTPTLHYPKEFWSGLGIKRSNVAMP